MEAIYEIEVKDMPVTVAVDTDGHKIHKVFDNIPRTQSNQSNSRENTSTSF